MVEVTQSARDAEGAVYNPANVEWAAPGDQQEDAWIVRFCDKDCREAIFGGPDAEREAWEYWNRYAPAYNIYVFQLAKLPAEARGHARSDAERDALVAEVARLHHIIASAVTVLDSSGMPTLAASLARHARAALAEQPEAIERPAL